MFLDLTLASYAWRLWFVLLQGVQYQISEFGFVMYALSRVSRYELKENSTELLLTYLNKYLG